MLISRHLIFASLKFRDFFLNHEIREINVSRKFHVIRYAPKIPQAPPLKK